MSIQAAFRFSSSLFLVLCLSLESWIGRDEAAVLMRNEASAFRNN